MKLNCIRTTICSLIAAASILTGCSSTNWHDNRGNLATKPATNYSAQAKTETQTTQTETKNQSEQVAAPTAAMAKVALDGKQPLLSLDSLVLPEQPKTALPYSFYNSSRYNFNSGALDYEKQLVLTPTEGMSLYFTSVNSDKGGGNSGEGGEKSKARKLATQEVLKQVNLDKISVMLPRDLSLYNKININAGFRFGIPSIRELVQALAGNKGHETWNEVLSEFKLGGYVNYMTDYGNFSIGAKIMPLYDGAEQRIKLDAPVMMEYEIRF